MDAEAFRKLWTEYKPPRVPDHLLPSAPKPVPQEVQAFQLWTNDLLATVGDGPTVVEINQAKLLLLDRYMDFRQLVGRAERNRAGAPGRPALASVFVAAYTALRRRELAQRGTLLFLPEPVEVRETQPPGLYIGERSP